MQQQPPRIDVTKDGPAVVVAFRDRDILDEVDITHLGEQLMAVTDGPQPGVVLDFTRVAHMSSAALGMLITLHKRIRERHQQLRLCHIRPEIYEIFAITKLNEIFQIYEDRAAAIASLS